MEFSLEQLPDVAVQIIARARQASLAAPAHATLITFSGDLGAGKTTMIKEIAKQLGVTDDLPSPTFVIYKKYEIQKSEMQNTTHTQPPLTEGVKTPWSYLIHGDMYRLESASDIQKLGWDELLANPENLVCIEWPEQILGAIPDWAVKVSLKHQGETRVLDIS